MEEKYIRVATTLYKIVQQPLQNGEMKQSRRVWNYDTLRQDHSQEFITQIEKHDGFCCVPSHTNYERSVGSFLNEYEPIDVEPCHGELPDIMQFLRHIFDEQIEMGLDYIQLLYTQPLQRLPILLLVSKERNTGKTTFLNLLRAIFGRNMTFNTNEDFRSQFNSDWATKLIVAVDEVLLDRKEDSERIKNLSTARSYKSEAKGKDRNEVEFFAKFVLCSNNEQNPIYIEQGETRYWVRKISPIMSDNPNLLGVMTLQIPALLHLLLHRRLTTHKVSRMWFDHKLIATDALRNIIKNNRNKAEAEMIQILQDINEIKEGADYQFCISDMSWMLESRGYKCNHSLIRNILQERWKLKPESSIYYQRERLSFDGTLDRTPCTGRCYTMTNSELAKLL